MDETIEGAFRDSIPDPTDPRRWLGRANGLDINGFYNEHDRSCWFSTWPVDESNK
ncbi:hypothetical protein Ate01nite_18140 [Actinoplanes teichomyceticus]|nr:hypothetical protein Ate01nite_18140 [Actinoplanes teichomyceticus]